MASNSSDEDDLGDFIALGTPVPETDEDYGSKKPITVQDLTAKDKQGRRRFHGAFTGGFSAGYFNSVGTKEGFTPSAFVSSKNRRLEDDGSGQGRSSLPEDFMDEEDMEEFGIAPRKFATAGNFTSEERKRKRVNDVNQITGSSRLDVAAAFNDLFVLGNLTVGIKLLRKMGWKEGQGLGPRVKQKTKKKKKAVQPKPGVKTYGCALPPSDDDSESSEEFIPHDMSSVTFAPRDITPICVEPKENVHGLGYRGLNPALALPGSHINLFSSPPVRSKSGSRGIAGQAFGVGAFEDEDEDIYSVDSMSNYDITMKAEEEGDNKFGWTAPRSHGKQSVPVTYVGKLLEGFCLSKTQLKPKKKFSAPSLPRGFKCHHWFRKQREASHIPEYLRKTEDSSAGSVKLNATDRGILLGETPIMSSVFDLIPKADRARIDATKEAISITKSLAESQREPEVDSHPTSSSSLKETQSPDGKSKEDLQKSGSASGNFLSRFQPATSPHTGSSHQADQGERVPLFQSGLTFQPFRKDAAKQRRYDQYLTLLKQGASDAYTAVASPEMTEWEKAREKDEFSKAAKMFRPMSAMMSSRFVSGAMIDDDVGEVPADSTSLKTDESKAAEMKMFGKLTREEHEWHPHQLLCKRFNVPNPYPGSDVLGIPGVKRDKYSVFNFLSFGDFQSGETQEPSKSGRQEETDDVKVTTPSMSAVRSKKATMASVFKVLDDPNFNKPSGSGEKLTSVTSSSADAAAAAEKSFAEGNVEEEGEDQEQEESTADMDLFRAIFKNSDSEESEEEDKAAVEEKSSSEAEPDSPESVHAEAETLQQDGAGKPIDVKLEPLQNTEAIEDAFRPLFTRRPKSAAASTETESEGANAQPAQTRPEAVSSGGADSSTGRQAASKSRWRHSNSGSKSIFSVLENMEQWDDKSQDTSSKAMQENNHTEGISLEPVENADNGEDYGPRLPLPATAPSIDTGDRLGLAVTEKQRGFGDNSDDDVAAVSYGPSLPPPSSSTGDSALETRGRPREKHQRGKESRSGHRKEKKKKSKHRKQKKHRKHKKSSKSRRRSKRESESSSGSEADTESDSAESVSDTDLLERLKDFAKNSKSLQKIHHL